MSHVWSEKFGGDPFKKKKKEPEKVIPEISAEESGRRMMFTLLNAEMARQQKAYYESRAYKEKLNDLRWKEKDKRSKAWWKKINAEADELFGGK